MKVITSVKEMQKIAQTIKGEKKTIGFVPTMGYLHEGHVSLFEKARGDNEIVVISVFVNPLQFGPTEDLDAYPRDFDRDRQVAEAVGVDYMFYPSVEEMYPTSMSVTVHVQARTNVLCGSSRPGHFDGVATVLTKLFHIVAPNRAYFGMKDAQQVAVVEGLVSDFNFPVQIVPVDTFREEDGLAKSSRNVYLSADERMEAPTLYASLALAREMIEAGTRNKQQILSAMTKLIEENTSGNIDYIEFLSFPQLEELNELTGKIIIALAVRFEKARLIDNIILQLK